MALGAKRVSGADIAISTTGLAGPGGDGVLPGGLSFAAVTDGERTVVEKIVTGHEMTVNITDMSRRRGHLTLHA